MSDTSPDYIAKVIHAAPFADNDAGIPQMVELIQALAAERDAADTRATDAEAAVAVVIEKAVSIIQAKGSYYPVDERQVVASIRELAPASGVEELARMRNEIRWRTAGADDQAVRYAALEAEVTQLRADLEVARAQVEAGNALLAAVESFVPGKRGGLMLRSAVSEARAALASAPARDGGAG